MKKLFLIGLVAFSTASLFAVEDGALQPGEVEKKGFLTSEWCAKNGYFVDCPLESLKNSPPVLFVHADGTTYNLDISDVAKHEIDEGMNKNNVTIIGKLQNGTIKVRAYKAPPPETKSFFKGCL